jgi:hypothetical protein
MKAKINFISVFLIISFMSLNIPMATTQVTVTYQVFYDELNPYGAWVDHPDYGYVWIPDIGSGFTPYSTNGYWLYTDAGWTWVSNYPWGWAPFHYGRWFYDPMYGYAWVPGYEWGPGWVVWRRSAGYYGWTPIGPGVSASYAYSNDYSVPYNRWIFVREKHFGRRNVNSYYISPSYNSTIINNSVVIHNVREDRTRKITYYTGPERQEVEKNTGRKISTIAVHEYSKPGQRVSRNQYSLYRPWVSNSKTTAPAKTLAWKDGYSKKKSATIKTPGSSFKSVQPKTQTHQINPAKRVQPSFQTKPLKQQPPVQNNVRNNSKDYRPWNQNRQVQERPVPEKREFQPQSQPRYQKNVPGGNTRTTSQMQRQTTPHSAFPSKRAQQPAPNTKQQPKRNFDGSRPPY